MNEKSITVRKSSPIATALPMGEEADRMMKWAGMMSETKFYQQMVATGGKNAVLAVFLAARELNIPPMQAINGGLWIVQGRVTLSAQMMGFMIRRAGHKIIKKRGTGEGCHLLGERADTKEQCEMVFTIQEAKKAGLIKPGGVWEKYPAVMLYNRCLSMLAKQLFQDTIGNAMIEGEIEEIDITPEQHSPVAKIIDPKVEAFKKAFELNNPSSEGSKFIVFLAKQTGSDIDSMIEQCSMDEDFEEQLVKFSAIEV